jgi:predicted acetyltransferase
MDIAIRTIEPDEFEAFLAALEVAFGGHLEPEDLERERSVLPPERCHAAFEGNEIVGGATSVPFTMTIPGGRTLEVAGVTGVGVKPSHRRRGVNTALMRRQLDDLRDRGEAVAILYASEGSIYGRFGYGLASFMCTVDLERERSGFVRGYEASGRFRILERAEALEQLLPVYERARRERPGALANDATLFEYRFPEKHAGKMIHSFFSTHETAGEIDAYAVYRIKDKWADGVSRSELKLDDLQALTPEAHADMWRFVLDVDLIHRVTAWNRPVDEPLLHLLREPRRLNLRLSDGLWARLLDVPAALEARGYEANGRVVFEVADAFCPWNDGRYALTVDAGVGACERTKAEPQLACSINDLGAVYVGGTTFRRLARAAQVRELVDGALAAADAMFASDPAPWCSFMF